MMRFSIVFLFPLLVLLGACKDSDTPEPTHIVAVAPIYSLDASTNAPVQVGEATFAQNTGYVTLNLQVFNLPAGGMHAVHLHEGSCENPGAHWNGGSSDSYCQVPSLDKTWGRPFLGDVGNISVGANGTGTLSLETDLWAVGDGSPLDVLGKVLMLHASGEDFAMECDPDHQKHPHNNPKIACGSIAKVE